MSCSESRLKKRESNKGVKASRLPHLPQPDLRHSPYGLLADSNTAGPNAVIEIELHSKSEMDVQRLK